MSETKVDKQAKVAAAIAKNKAALTKAISPKDARTPEDMLALPVMQMLKWKNISLPGKVFFVMFVIMFVIEIIAEVYYYTESRQQFSASGMTFAFWMRFIIGAIIAVVMYGLYMIIIHVLYYSGYKIFAWFMIFVPLLYFVGTLVSARFFASLFTTAKGEVAKSWFTSMFMPTTDTPTTNTV